MSDRTWHKGPPPHIGWWNASSIQSPYAWRWWDGKNWSWPAHSEWPVELAVNQTLKLETGAEIKWSGRWPEGARVPRIDPRKGGQA